ncbi:MAG: nicotinate phosphoribosyltransferase [Clostridia bacterium]|nr:nicotinate phosphoribosyltransferase [Clostridia bacterium]
MFEHVDLSMLADFYEFTMADGFFSSGLEDRIAYFDTYFRAIPDNGGYAIMAGTEPLMEYLNNFSFSEDDIAYFRSKQMFSELFLDYLKNFKFTCDVWAVPEGTPVFPGEPLVIVRGPIVQAQLLETMILLTVNHQSLIATKANRIVRAADGRPVMEFGARRAQGYSAAMYGSRAAYIAGCTSTSCTITDKDCGIPAAGTMAHSWVQMFPSELEAFRAYAQKYPTNCVLLVDTYNVLKSGIPNAIRTFDEILKPIGIRPLGVRIDSGDLTYLSRKCRKMLDEAGYPDCKIVASNSLDEYIIRDMLTQGAKLDSFGVGERLITSKSEPVLGGVYKLTATEEPDGTITPKIKLSENVAKITNPGFKQLYRLYEKESGKAIADVITLHDEVIDSGKPYEIFDPEHTWKRKTITDFTARPLLTKLFENGHPVYTPPSIQEVQSYCAAQVDTLWDEVTRLENPHRYYVDLSRPLWNMKQELLSKHSI